MNKNNHLRIPHLSIPSTIGVMSLGMLAALGYAALTPRITDQASAMEYCQGTNGTVECDTTAQVDTYARIAPVVSIGMQSDVVMDVVPKSTGAVVEEPISVKVSTNSAEGYSLYMKTLGSTNSLTSTTPGNASEIKAVDGGEHGVNLTALAKQGNVWGYSLNDSNTTNRLYQAVPMTASQPIRVTDTIENPTDDLELTFALAVDTSLPSGTYNNSVLVSAVANPVTITNLSELVFMQDMTPSICANTAYDENGATGPSTANSLKPVTKQLIDTRDGKKYWVAKLKDGNCWMVQNLALDLSTERTLTPADTDVEQPWTPESNTNTFIQVPANASYYSTYSWNLGEITLATPARDITLPQNNQTGDNGTTSIAYSGPVTIDNERHTFDAHYLIGNYYQYNAAAAGTASTVNNADLTSSICPKGWKLPTSGPTENDSGSFKALFDSYGITNKVAAGEYDVTLAPFYLIRSGAIRVYDNSFYASRFVGNGGYLVSSRITESNNVYVLNLYGATLNVSHGPMSMPDGNPIRCLAR